MSLSWAHCHVSGDDPPPRYTLPPHFSSLYMLQDRVQIRYTNKRIVTIHKVIVCTHRAANNSWYSIVIVWYESTIVYGGICTTNSGRPTQIFCEMY